MSDAPHLLVVMGSGETTPTMVTPHQRLLARLGDDPDAVLLDTPYGFQANADEITARTQQYFGHNVGTDVDVVRLPRPLDADAVTLEQAQTRLADADWVFVGPGSPTYLSRQLAPTRIPEVLRARCQQPPGITVVSSAAAATIGTQAIPVYEIYKAGLDPHWAPGLGILPAIGLDAVLVPHYDNSEGGTHDTRYCYLGEQRLRRMQQELADGTWVLGVDEHTAIVVDLAAGDVEVLGRGVLTVRRPDGTQHVVPAGDRTTLDELRALAAGRAGGAGTTPDAAAPAATGDERGGAASDPSDAADDPLADAVDDARARFVGALDDADARTATGVVLELEELVRAWAADTLTGTGLDDAVAVLRELVARLGSAADAGLDDPRERLAPFVELLLDVRARARAEGDYATSDLVRDRLGDAGVEVRDTGDGTTWQLRGVNA